MKAHPPILVDGLELSELVVESFTDVDTTSSTLHVLDRLRKRHAQAFHYLDPQKNNRQISDAHNTSICRNMTRD